MLELTQHCVDTNPNGGKLGGFLWYSSSCTPLHKLINQSSSHDFQHFEIFVTNLSQPHSEKLDNMGNTYSRSSRDASELKIEMQNIAPFRFLDLPSEIRLAVYRQILCTKQLLYWTEPNLTSDYTSCSFLAAYLPNFLGARKEWPIAVSSYVATRTTRIALLFTCKTIYREAIELFYQHNFFVIRAMTIGFHPIVRQRLVLLHIQRLRIQYINTAEPSTLKENDLIDLVDATISSCLQNAIDCCPNLKSLTICDIPNPATVAYYAWLRTGPVFTAETDDSFH